MKEYKNVTSALIGKSVREQYQLLLQTKEWYNFREKILLLRHGTCEDCQREGGDIEIERPQDEYEREMNEVVEHNTAFRRRMKEIQSHDLYEQLLNGEIGGEKPYPSRTKTIGRVVLEVHHKLYILNKLPWEYPQYDVKLLCSECHLAEHQRNEILLYKDDKKEQYRKLPVCSKCFGSGYLPQYYHIDYGRCWDCDGAGVLWTSGDYWVNV